MPRPEPPTTAVVPAVLQWLRRLSLSVSLALLVGASVCFAGRWDAVAVVTLPPFWAWSFLGIVPLLVTWRLRPGWLPRTVLTAWLVTAVAWSDDLGFLIRSPFTDGSSSFAQTGNRHVRVVSLNCASSVAAAREVGQYRPDIVLLQESPASNELVRLCQEWFGQQGGMIYGLDCSVLTRGQVKVVDTPRSLRFTCGEVQSAEGLTMDVVSLRLHPPDIRLDLWSAECWKQHTRGRQIRRSQLQELIAALPPVSKDRAVIVGGDFNAPAGDAIFRLLRPFLKDCFGEAGTGWGDTALNSMPISRPDQIWASRRIVTRRACATKTLHSDHRMVIADLTLL
jgi:vancomycin resistance protein VanJ